MEYDRYQESSKLFILGMVALLISLSLLAFALYILPFLLWDLPYKVPGFILDWREFFKFKYNLSELKSSWLIFFIFIIPSILCGYISYFSSNYIDNRLYQVGRNSDDENNAEHKKNMKESVTLTLKILGGICLTVLLIGILELIILS